MRIQDFSLANNRAPMRPHMLLKSSPRSLPSTVDERGRWPIVPIIIGLILMGLVSVDPASGAMLSVVFPLSLLITLTRNYRHLLDYRVVYLLGITVWSVDHCTGLFLLRHSAADLLHRYADALAMYGYGVLLSTFAVLVFWRDTVAIGAFLEKEFRPRAKPLKPFFFAAVSIAYGVATFVTGSSDSNIGSALSSFVLVSFATVQIALALRGRWVAFTLVCMYTSALFSENAPNRTSLLVPLVISCLAAIASCNRLNWRIFSLKSGMLMLALIGTLLLADWQKQLGTSFVEAVLSDTPKGLGFDKTTMQSNYLVRSGATLDYFSYLQFIIDHRLYSPGSWLLQVVTSVAPRSVFAAKPNFDLSAILYEAHVVDAPLYFEFLFDRIADSGLYGILLYNFGYLFLTRYAYKTYSKVHTLRADGRECGLYITALVTLFLVIRGPIILIAWFYLYPMVLILIRNRLARWAVSVSKQRSAASVQKVLPRNDA